MTGVPPSQPSIVECLREANRNAPLGFNIYAEAADEIESLRTKLASVVSILDQRMADYEEMESRNDLTEFGKHGKLVTANIRRDIEFAISRAALQEPK